MPSYKETKRYNMSISTRRLSCAHLKQWLYNMPEKKPCLRLKLWSTMAMYCRVAWTWNKAHTIQPTSTRANTLGLDIEHVCDEFVLALTNCAQIRSALPHTFCRKVRNYYDDDDYRSKIYLSFWWTMYIYSRLAFHVIPESQDFLLMMYVNICRGIRQII